MKKLKSRIIGVILILIVAFCFTMVPQIYAEESSQETETEENLTCQDLADKYGLYMEKGTGENEYDIIKDPTDSCEGKVHSDASFILVSVNGINDTTGKTLTATNKKITIEAGMLVNGHKHYVSATLKNINNENELVTIEYSMEVEEAGGASVSQVNTNYWGECVRLRDTAAAGGTAGDQFFRQAFPYCFKESGVAINYTAEETKQKVDNIISLWNAFQAQNAAGSVDFNTAFNDIKTKAHMKPTTNVVTDPLQTVITLKCAYDRVSTGADEVKTYTNEYGDTISSTEYYLNKDYYYSTETTRDGTVTYTYNFAPGNTVTETQTACERTCEESVKVEYGPPVASKAGLCFEYKVKVTSYVKCTSKVIANPPETFTNYCNPAPVCYSTSGKKRNKEQAGPKEEFDQCIQACDGGKYSESCSLQCYKQVYGKQATKLAINYESYKAAKIAMTTSTTSYTLAECLEDNQNYYGCYVYNSGTEASINWYSLKNYNLDGTSKGTTQWNDRFALGRWYIDRVYLQDNGTYDINKPNFVRNNPPGKGYDITGIRTDNCRNETYCGSYVADTQGIYRSNSWGTLCSDNCWWRTDVCDVNPNSVSGNEYMNPGTIAKDAAANQKEYEDAAAACIAAATCSNRTSTFSISLNYDTDDASKIEISFPYNEEPTPLKTNGTNNLAGSGSSIMLSYAGCYENKNAGNNYMAEWSFPGTYIHNKTGEISFKPQSTEGWYYDDQKFCMPLDATSVNKKWWEWYKLGNTCYTTAEIENELNGSTGTSNGYNITAKTYNVNDEGNPDDSKGFGYFGWGFEIKCFYALRNEICNVQDDGCCGTSQKEANGVSNYTFRSVAVDDLFPNAAEEGVIDPDKRAIGFNWTSKALSLKNSDYEINPVALRQHIESNASTLHSDEATNLDYRFYLTPATLAKIKADNKANGYATWTGGAVETRNGINVYKSNLFRDVGTGSKVLSDIADSVIKLGEPGVNNENYIKFGG